MNRALRNSKYFFRYYYKQMILILFVIFSILMFRGYAFSQEQYDNSAGFERLAYDMIDEIAGTKTTEEISKSVEVTYTGDSVSISGISVSGVAPVLKKINDISKALAITFLIVSFGISLINMRPNDTTEEEIFKRMIILSLGIILCTKALDVCMTLANIGSQVASRVSEVAPVITGDNGFSITDSFKDVIYESSNKHEATGFDRFFEVLGNVSASVYYCLQLVIPWIALKAAWVLMNVVCWGRAIEILVLAAFSPMAFADIIEPNNLGSSPGMRFIKNFFALSLSGALIITVVIICQAINTTMLGNTITGEQSVIGVVWKMVVIGFAQCAMALKANQVAKTALGMG